MRGHPDSQWPEDDHSGRNPGRDHAKPRGYLYDCNLSGPWASGGEGPGRAGIGKAAAAANATICPTDGEVSEEDVWNQLRQCYDPEIPVNIVDLGLVYDCRLSKKEDGGTRVEVKMTLTAPGCGMGPAIAHDAQSKILSIDGIDEADVQLVWDPPWNQNMISEAGRMKLGMI